MAASERHETHGNISEFIMKYCHLTREKFLFRCKNPFLVFDCGPEVDGDDISGSWASTCYATGPEEVDRSMARRNISAGAVEIRKTDRNRFSTIITAGRASTNDIVIGHKAVSKFHSFFRIDFSGGDVFIQDAGSKYGTEVRGMSLSQDDPLLLMNGDRIVFAGAVRAIYYEPARFYDFLKIMADM